MSRIDFDNIVVLYEGPSVSDDFLRRFAALPYPKALLSGIIKEATSYDFYHPLSIYED